jgi:hypothetical protein
VDVDYQWQLAPAPAPFDEPLRSGGEQQAYRNASSWSWGGAIVHVPDASVNRGFEFHMFAEAEVNGCGVKYAWQTNARVIHAVSETAIGPYVYSDDALPVWHAGPSITCAPDGTFLLFSMGTTNSSQAVDCVDGWDRNQTNPRRALMRQRLHVSRSPFGPWSEVRGPNDTDILPAAVNPNPVGHALKNGSVIVQGGGIFLAEHWRGPYIRQRSPNARGGPVFQPAKNCSTDPRNAARLVFPNSSCALEDRFFWFDEQVQRWKGSAHQKLHNAFGPWNQCTVFSGTVGYAESVDANFWSEWKYDFWAPAAGLRTQLSNGTELCLLQRERPKVFHAQNRTYLTNSACPLNIDQRGVSGCFTFIQEVLSQTTSLETDGV